MNELVFLEPNKIDAIPFTTSDIIAERAEINYRQVQRMIETHKNRLEKFGIVRFENTLSGKAGMPKKVYCLNEQQATLLITFLKNTDIVADFKTELVQQFYLMKEELRNRRNLREQLKPIRRDMTDVIKEMDSDNIWAYKQYTDLAYKAATGKIAKKLREERGASKKATAIDYMTSDEIQRVARKESQIAVLRDMGMNYEQIKALIFHNVIPQIKIENGKAAGI